MRGAKISLVPLYNPSRGGCNGGITADDFARAVRGGGDKLRLDALILTTPDRSLTGRGMLRIEKDRLHVEMTLGEGVFPPATHGPTVTTASEFWKLAGLIDENLPFFCNFGPGFATHSSNGFVTLKATVNPIHLGKQIWREWPDVQTNAPEADSEHDVHAENEDGITGSSFDFFAGVSTVDTKSLIPAEEEEDLSFEFHAWIADYELVSTNGGSRKVETTDFHGELMSSAAANLLQGETAFYEFAFLEQPENGVKNLYVVLRSKEGVRGGDEKEDEKRFLALLSALAFTHGKNAWPYRVKYWRGGKLADKVTAIRPLPHTPHAPFSGLAQNVELTPLIAEIATRLEEPLLRYEDLTKLLFLFRQAGNPGVYHEIGTLGICTIFESLVGLMFDHFNLKEATLQGMGLPEFSEAKAKLQAHLATWTDAEQDESHRRLRGLIQSANPLTMREKLKALCLRLDIKWDGYMDKVFASWKMARNPLAHGDFGSDDEQAYKDNTYAESRIAGGLNTIVLKFFGYSGYYNASVFEPGFQKM